MISWRAWKVRIWVSGGGSYNAVIQQHRVATMALGMLYDHTLT